MTAPRSDPATLDDGDTEFTIRFNGRSISCPGPMRLLDALLHGGAEHRHICGGLGFCTSCRVQVQGGPENLSPVSALERERLGGAAGSLRLACQTRVTGPVELQVPRPVSRFSPDGD